MKQPKIHRNQLHFPVVLHLYDRINLTHYLICLNFYFVLKYLAYFSSKFIILLGKLSSLPWCEHNPVRLVACPYSLLYDQSEISGMQFRKLHLITSHIRIVNVWNVKHLLIFSELPGFDMGSIQIEGHPSSRHGKCLFYDEYWLDFHAPFSFMLLNNYAFTAVLDKMAPTFRDRC